MIRVTCILIVLGLAACTTSRRAARTTYATRSQARGIPAEVVALAAQTKPGGSFFIEFAADGTLLGADAEVTADTVPPALVAAANAKHPGGEVIGGEKEWAQGRIVWEVVKVIDGQTWEILVTTEGKVIGGGLALAPDAWPANVVEAAVAATDGGSVDAVEHVWGPEAWGGEYYHVKVTKDGDSLRVGVNQSGKVVRVVRRVPGQVRVPR